MNRLIFGSFFEISNNKSDRSFIVRQLVVGKIFYWKDTIYYHLESERVKMR